MIDVGVFNMADEEMQVHPGKIHWHNNTPPVDKIIRRTDILRPHKAIQTVLSILTFLGQVLAISFLIVNIKYRNTRYGHIKHCIPSAFMLPQPQS